jgi:putative membrane protein
MCAINPYDRAVWWAENAPVWLTVGAIIWIHLKYHRFSNLALIFMSVFIFLHTIGGHYTFARVPFDIVSEFFGFERNHYDRMAHFSVGFYAYAITEILLARKLTNSKFILFSYPLFVILAIAGLYELFEWQFAVMSDGNAGIEVLGSQGDIWDAQKDILSDTLGAIFSLTIFWFIKKNEV